MTLRLESDRDDAAPARGASATGRVALVLLGYRNDLAKHRK